MNRLRQYTQDFPEPTREPMTKTERFFAVLIWGFIVFGSIGFWLGLIVILGKK